MDRTKFEWTSPRFEKIVLDLSKEVYGNRQGQAFFKFVLSKVDAYFLSDDKNYKSSYMGFNKDVGAEIIHYYPEEYNYGLKFSTDKPGVRK